MKPAAQVSGGAVSSQYQILGHLATGGMAELYIARAVAAAGRERHVVLKRIMADYARNHRFVTMFLDEARLAAQLHHPNIAQVHDIGRMGGSYFFTMEYVHGENVRNLLHRVAGLKRRIPLAHTLAIVRGAAAGLEYAHDKRGLDGRPLEIVHRDVTPSNLMVSYDGAIKLVDFGIAKAADRMTETRTGAVKGKVAYMSPEQCMGHPLDRRSDLFSLGIILFEMATMTRLFKQASDFETMNAIVNQPVPTASSRCADLPRGLEAIIARALARRPEERFATAGELGDALAEVVRREGLDEPPAALGGYLRELFGERPEPWHELEASGEGSDLVTVEAAPALDVVAMPAARTTDRQVVSEWHPDAEPMAPVLDPIKASRTRTDPNPAPVPTPARPSTTSGRALDGLAGLPSGQVDLLLDQPTVRSPLKLPQPLPAPVVAAAAVDPVRPPREVAGPSGAAPVVPPAAPVPAAPLAAGPVPVSVSPSAPVPPASASVPSDPLLPAVAPAPLPAAYPDGEPAWAGEGERSWGADGSWRSEGDPSWRSVTALPARRRRWWLVGVASGVVTAGVVALVLAGRGSSSRSSTPAEPGAAPRPAMAAPAANDTDDPSAADVAPAGDLAPQPAAALPAVAPAEAAVTAPARSPAPPVTPPTAELPPVEAIAEPGAGPVVTPPMPRPAGAPRPTTPTTRPPAGKTTRPAVTRPAVTRPAVTKPARCGDPMGLYPPCE